MHVDPAGRAVQVVLDVGRVDALQVKPGPRVGRLEGLRRAQGDRHVEGAGSEAGRTGRIAGEVGQDPVQQDDPVVGLRGVLRLQVLDGVAAVADGDRAESRPVLVVVDAGLVAGAKPGGEDQFIVRQRRHVALPVGGIGPVLVRAGPGPEPHSQQAAIFQRLQEQPQVFLLPTIPGMVP